MKPRAMATTALINKATVARLAGFGSTSLDGTGTLAAKLRDQRSDRVAEVRRAGEWQRRQPGVSLPPEQGNRGRQAVAPSGHVQGRQRRSVADPGCERTLAPGRRHVERNALGQTMCGDGGVYVRVDACQSGLSQCLRRPDANRAGIERDDYQLLATRRPANRSGLSSVQDRNGRPSDLFKELCIDSLFD